MLVVALVAAACGGGDGDDGDADASAGSAEATEPEPDQVTIVSEDGELAITASTAVAEEFDLEIVLLDPADWPEEVAGGENLPGVKVYDLLPDGATFDEPVVVTRKLDLANFADLDLGPFDAPLVTMVTRGDDGVYELLSDLTATRIGSSLFVSGATTHFTELLASNDGFVFRFDPRSGPLFDAPSFREAAPELAEVLADAKVEVPVSASERAEPFIVELGIVDVYAGSTPAVSGLDASEATGEGLVTGGYAFPVDEGEGATDERDVVDFFGPLIVPFPDDLGRSSVGRPELFEVGSTGRISMRDAPSTRTFLGLNDGEPPDDFRYRLRLLLFGTAEDEDAQESDPPEPPAVAEGPGSQLIADGGALRLGVTHSEFEGFASFVFWLLTGIDLSPGQNAHAFLFDPTVPLGEGRISDVRRCDVGDDIECRTGINSFGPYGAGFFFVDDAQLDQLLRVLETGSTQDFWVFASALSSEECAVNVTDTETGEVRVYDVGPEEGPFAPVGELEAFAPCGQ